MTPSQSTAQAVDEREELEVGTAEDEALDIGLITQILAQSKN